MFDGCENVKDVDLSSFNTKNLESMKFMFSSCSNLENINLSNFDIKILKVWNA